ncbi:MAG: hypothetical protein JWM98_297 [Thermoleophilia bacterium]|nr:hypothetical protein [Thermoleophilia bacterium]
MPRTVRSALLAALLVVTSLVLAAPALAAVPGSPTNLVITRTSPSTGAQFPLSWGRPADNTATAYAYSITQGATDEAPTTPNVTDNPNPTVSVVVQGIGVGTWYAHVRAFNADGAGPTVHSAASIVSGPPAITITSSSVGPREVIGSPHETPLIASTSATITFSYENADRAQCGLDGNLEVPCASPYTVSGLKQGGHSLIIRAVGEGQTNAPAFFAWRVDTEGPKLIFDTPQQFSTTADSRVGFTVYDDHLGTLPATCTLDGVARPCDTTGGFNVFVPRGVHRVVVSAADSLGNVGTASAVYKRLAGPLKAPTAGADKLLLTEYDEQIFSLAGADLVLGDEGNDKLQGGAGNDTLRGGEDGDTLGGELGNDHLFGDQQPDVLDGGPGADVLSGGDDNDQLKGQLGKDTFVGGGGDDIIVSFDKGVAEVVNCGPGKEDTVYADRNDRLIGCENVNYKMAKRQTITSLLREPEDRV